MFFHSQNLNDEIPRRYWLHGRSFLHLGKAGRTSLNAEWCFPSKSFDLSIDLNSYGETALSARISLWLFSLYLGLEWHWLYKLLEPITRRSDMHYTNGRNIGIKMHGGYLWIELWHDPMEHRSVDPWWWQITINFPDLIRGRAHYTSEVLEERDIVVPMPEKAYPAKAKRLVRRWSFPRWPTQENMSVEIDIPGGIPFEGKGENSWDMGHDATYSMSCNARSIAEGVGKLVGSVLATRIKNGGWGDWVWQKTDGFS